MYRKSFDDEITKSGAISNAQIILLKKIHAENNVIATYLVTERLNTAISVLNDRGTFSIYRDAIEVKFSREEDFREWALKEFITLNW